MLGKTLQILKNTKYIDIWSDPNYPCLYDEGVLFTQNNCFLLFGFLFFFPWEGLRRMCSKAKKNFSSVPLGKYLLYCDYLVLIKFWYFWKIVRSEFKFHSTKCLRNSAAKLWKRKLNFSHVSGVARISYILARINQIFPMALSR